MVGFGTPRLGAYLCAGPKARHGASGKSLQAMNQDSSRIMLGRFAGAHGLKGELIVHTYTEAPEKLTDGTNPT